MSAHLQRHEVYGVGIELTPKGFRIQFKTESGEVLATQNCELRDGLSRLTCSMLSGRLDTFLSKAFPEEYGLHLAEEDEDEIEDYKAELEPTDEVYEAFEDLTPALMDVATSIARFYNDELERYDVVKSD